MSHHTAATSDASHKSYVVTCSSDQPAINLGSYHLFFGFDNLLEWLRALSETTIFQFIVKSYDKGERWTARWKRAQSPGQGTGKAMGLPRPFQAPPPSKHLRVFNSLEAVWTAYFWDLGVGLRHLDVIHHELSLQISPLPGVGMGWKAPGL